MPLAGAIIRASDLGIYVQKASTTSVTNTTAAAADPHLVVPLLGGCTYEVSVVLSATGPAAGDLLVKYATTGTITSLGGRACSGPSLAITSGSAAESMEVRAGAIVTLTTSMGYGVDGSTVGTAVRERFVAVCTSSGNLTLTWAQWVANATPTVLGVGSWMIARRIA